MDSAQAQAKPTSALYISNRSMFLWNPSSVTKSRWRLFLLFCFTCLESRIPRPHASCCLGAGCICRCRYNDRPPTKSHRAKSAGLGLARAVFVDLRLAGAKSVGIWLVRAEIVGMRTNQMRMCWNCRWAASTPWKFGFVALHILCAFLILPALFITYQFLPYTVYKYYHSHFLVYNTFHNNVCTTNILYLFSWL